MKKIILLIILGSLVTSCKTTNPNDPTVINDKVKKIKVVVEYSGDLVGWNRGSKIKQTKAEKADSAPRKYTVDMAVYPNTTMADFILAFHKRTGLKNSYTVSGGAPPNRHSIKTSYDHDVNDTRVNSNNENKPIKEWNINNNSTVVIQLFGGSRGRVD